MAGYWNRDAERAGREPFRAYCAECFPVPLEPAWRAVSRRRPDPPGNLRDYLRDTFGGSARVLAYLRGELDETPDGYAYDPGTVGAPCETCGRLC